MIELAPHPPTWRLATGDGIDHPHSHASFNQLCNQHYNRSHYTCSRPAVSGAMKLVMLRISIFKPEDAKRVSTSFSLVAAVLCYCLRVSLSQNRQNMNQNRNFDSITFSKKIAISIIVTSLVNSSVVTDLKILYVDGFGRIRKKARGFGFGR